MHQPGDLEDSPPDIGSDPDADGGPSSYAGAVQHYLTTINSLTIVPAVATAASDA